MQTVILTQKRELELRLSEPYVERQLAPIGLDNDLIKVVLGPRRSGKSFYAMRLASSLGPFGYVNFDDERLAGIKDYDRMLIAVDTLYEHPKILLLDEVQNLPQWELLVNRLQRQGISLVITGSNAHLLSSELATHLTGRHIPIVLFPFCFGEYLACTSRHAELTDAETAQGLRDYSETGGFPEPLVKKVSRSDYLNTLLRSILYKDIIARHHIRSVQGIENLATYLMCNVAQEYSLRTLCEVTQCKSPHTIDKYLLYLDQAFLFFSLKRYSYKARERLVSNRKIYCTDNGWITSASIRFSSDTGKLYENLVAIELYRHALAGQWQVFYWKSPQGDEVDFLIKQGLEITQLIQVCVSTDNPKTKSRETRALLKAAKAFKCSNLLILTDSEDRSERATWHDLAGDIRYMPLWRWFDQCKRM